MKKIFIISLLLLSLTFGSTVAHAQTSAAQQPSAADAKSCIGVNATQDAATNKCTRTNGDGTVTNCGGLQNGVAASEHYCTIVYSDGSYTVLDANGIDGSYTNYTAQGVVTGANNRSITNGSLGLANSTTGTANNPAITTATPATTASTQTTTSGAVSTSNNFVALTNIPAITGLADSNSNSLADFFNNLYKICIGIAATLAVIKIIQAGIMYMGGDSITETKEARSMIVTSILGLVVVLSPAIVFGIINPNILSLQIGGTAGLASLTPPSLSTTASTAATTAASCASQGMVYKGGETLVTAAEQTCCTAQTGFTLEKTTTAYICVAPANASNGCAVTYAAGSLTNIQGNDTASQQCCTTQKNPTCSLSAMNAKTGMYICSCGTS